MKFGKHFEKELVAQWRGHYIAYNELKAAIKRIELEQQQEGLQEGLERPAGEYAGRSADHAKLFNKEVEEQVKQCCEFYEQQRELLQRDLESAERQRVLLEQARDPKRALVASRETLLQEYYRLGEQLLRIFHFLKLNTTALRKILKKFSKKVRGTGPGLLSKVEANQDSMLAQNLNRLKDYSLLQPLVNKIRAAIVELQLDLRKDMTGPDAKLPGQDTSRYGAAWSAVPSVRFQQYKRHGQILLQDLSILKDELEESTSFLSFLSSQAVISFRPVQMRKQSALEKGHQHEVSPMSRTGRKLLPGKYEALVQGEAEGEYEAQSNLEEEEDKISEYMNLASTFFYLANYNICLPTSGEYAVHLGLRPSVSGVIVAMTPIAALISAVVYSYWSNFSFKSPLMCSTLLLVIGNLLYGLAWDSEITSLILIGRFVTGLGGCRAVNRRYIADNISVENRTKASAAFVAAGALGMACGPLMASFFSGMNTFLFGVTLNEMTSPAFFMAFVWVLYGVVLALLFKEPLGIYANHEEEVVSGSELLSENDEYFHDEDEDEYYDDDDDDYFGDNRVILEDDETDRPRFDDGIDIVLEPRDHAQHSYCKGLPTEKTPVSGEQDGPMVSPNYGTIEFAGNSNAAFGSRKVEANQEYYTLLSRDKFFARRKARRANLTILCLWLIFWVKLVQEALLTALPLTMPEFYAWGPGKVGVLMASLGLAVVPLNMIVVLLTRLLSLRDSLWIKTLLVPVILGCVSLVVDHTSIPSFPRAMLGLFVVFIFSQIMEAVVMSFFSKVIDSRLAAGTFNSGLLATEAGTLGRAAGNAIITILGMGTAFELQTHLYIFNGIASGITWAIVLFMLR